MPTDRNQTAADIRQTKPTVSLLYKTRRRLLMRNPSRLHRRGRRWGVKAAQYIEGDFHRCYLA